LKNILNGTDLRYGKSFIHNPNDERNATQQSLTSEQKAGNKNYFIAFPECTLKYLFLNACYHNFAA